MPRHVLTESHTVLHRLVGTKRLATTKWLASSGSNRLAKSSLYLAHFDCIDEYGFLRLTR
jgi:hypothetical protein